MLIVIFKELLVLARMILFNLGYNGTSYYKILAYSNTVIVEGLSDYI
jgi:hypothetical protein